MREDRPFIEYLNEVDNEGKPIKHIRWPDQLPKAVEKLIINLIIDEFGHSGIPKDEGDRQELFGFIRRIKNTWGIIYKSLLGVCVLSGITGVVYIIKVIDK